MRWTSNAGALALALLLVGCGEDEEKAPAPDGAALYTQYCAFCHGEEGEGYISDDANALANQDFLITATDEFLTAAIVEGRPGTPMSPWGEANGGPLADDEVQAIVAHVRRWQQEETLDVHGEVVTGVAQRGAPVYAARCASCHGDEGQGISALSLVNPWFLATASDGFLRYGIAKGRRGTAMQAYEGVLTDQAIADLVAWLRSKAVDPDAEPAAPYTPDLSVAVQNPGGPEPELTLRADRFAPAEQVRDALAGGAALVMLDARPTSDYLQSHIDGAVSIPFYDVPQYVDELPRDTWIVTYCGCPHAVSGQAYDALAEAGFTRIAVLDEGFYVWEERGYPMWYPED